MLIIRPRGPMMLLGYKDAGTTKQASMRAMPVRICIVTWKRSTVLIALRTGGKRASAQQKDLHARFASV